MIMKRKHRTIQRTNEHVSEIFFTQYYLKQLKHSWNNVQYTSVKLLFIAFHKSLFTQIFKCALSWLYDIHLLRMRDWIIVLNSVLRGIFEYVMTWCKVYSISWMNATAINNSNKFWREPGFISFMNKSVNKKKAWCSQVFENSPRC